MDSRPPGRLRPGSHWTNGLQGFSRLFIPGAKISPTKIELAFSLLAGLLPTALCVQRGGPLAEG